MSHHQKLSVFVSVVLALAATTFTSDTSAQAPSAAQIQSRLETARVAAAASEPAWPESRRQHLRLLRERTAVPAKDAAPRGAALATGTITGSVVDDVTGAPLFDVDVTFHDADGTWVDLATTDGSGVYAAALAAGSYCVKTGNASAYLDELYDDVPALPPPVDFADCTLVEVTDGATVTVDFALSPGFGVFGQVTAADSGAGLSTVTVYLMRPDWEVWIEAATGADGSYATAGVPPGEYYAVALDSGCYVGEVHDDVVCSGWCVLEDVGTPIVVAGPGTLEIDFALDEGGIIQAHYTDAATGAPLDRIGIDYFTPAGEWIGANMSDGSGISWSPPYPPGSYRVITSNLEGYLEELYDDHLCVGGFCHPTAGDEVVLAACENTVLAIALDRGHQIVGTVTDAATLELLPEIGVSVYDAGWGEQGWGGVVDDHPDGHHYATSALPDGTYYAMAYDWVDYVPELYDDVPCPGGWSCSLDDGTGIVLGPELETQVVDFALDLGGEICGLVSDAATGTGLADATVMVWGADWSWQGQAQAADDGSFSARRLAAGSHFATTWETGCFVGEAWDDLTCPGGWSCDVPASTPIPITPGSVVCDVDFALDLGGTISGQSVCQGQPAYGVVDILDPVGNWVTSDFIHPPDGALYATPAVPMGTYRAATFNSAGCIDELFDDLPWPQTPIGDGTPVTVTSCTGAQADFDLLLELIFADGFESGDVSAWAGGG